MPELPEVETVRRGLERVMRDRIISHVEVRVPGLRWPFPEHMKEKLTGVRVESIDRLGKYLLLGLSSKYTLIAHLGMSGRFTVFADCPEDFDRMSGEPGSEKHDHVVFLMSDGSGIVYNDPRRFGMMDLVDTTGVRMHRLLAGLGPEPLGNSFSAPVLRKRLMKRSTPIKMALLDQRVVAGLGNIYVCEALWDAGISPCRPASAVVSDRNSLLVESIRKVLRDAIDAGGSTLRDHRGVDGELGYFQHQFSVYGKEGQSCPRNGCDGTISRFVQSGRSTFHCEYCQK